METKHRVLIESYVERNPGLNTRAIATGVGVCDSTADYHLRRLGKEGRVGLERQGRDLTWWRAGCGYCPVLRKAIPAFRREGVAEAARALDLTPTTAAELATRAGLGIGVARWASNVLVQAGLARRSVRGRILLVEGAQRCVQMAEGATRCDQWGRCPVSLAAGARPPKAARGGAASSPSWTPASRSSQASS